MFIKAVQKSLFIILYFTYLIIIVSPFGLKFNPWQFQNSENGFGEVYFSDDPSKLFLFLPFIILSFLIQLVDSKSKVKKNNFKIIFVIFGLLNMLYVIYHINYKFFQPRLGAVMLCSLFPLSILIIITQFIEKIIIGSPIPLEDILDE